MGSSTAAVAVVALLMLNGLAALDQRLWDEEIVDNKVEPVESSTVDPENGDIDDLVPPVDDEENKVEKIGEKVALEGEGGEEEEGNKINWEQLLNSELFEGDIENVNASDVAARNAIINPRLKWPKGIVPYVIDNRFSGRAVNTIRTAIQQYHRNTCIRFIPRRNQRDFVFIRPGVGCSSSVGRQGGRQFVNLGRGCVYTGIVVHELMHAIGFWHEQSRPDRDRYVDIKWNNIQPNMRHNFQKFSHGEVDTLKLRYDIGSVMHYGAYYFAINSHYPTITTLSGDTRMGQRYGFSRLDIKKVRKLYKCCEDPQESIDCTKPLFS